MLKSGTSKKSILIVDNSLLIIERVSSLLREVKIVGKIFIATNFNEAVSMLNEKKPEIVLLDIQLPGKNGIELLKYLVRNYPDTKVVMLSNLVSMYYQRLCKKLGAVGFIDKSREFDLIPEVVAAL